MEHLRPTWRSQIGLWVLVGLAALIAAAGLTAPGGLEDLTSAVGLIGLGGCVLMLM